MAGLSDEESIERISMMIGKGFDRQCVGHGHGEREEPISGHSRFQIVGGIELAQRFLDGDLPNHGGAHIDGVLAIADRFAGGFR